jgi:small-conductance mechanosensitive channel
MKFGHKSFDELGTLELAVLFIAGLHLAAFLVWMFLTATQKPARVGDRVDLTKAD